MDFLNSLIFTPLAITIENGLFLHEILHGVVAIPFAILLWKKYKNRNYVIIFFIAVYLIDIDHLIDYWDYSGLSFSMQKFVELDYFKHRDTTFVPLHAWEWLIILFFLFRRYKKAFLLIFLLALSIHMFWDSIEIGSVSFYSILYRAFNNFAGP